MLAVIDGDLNFTFGVENVDGGEFGETVIDGRAHVLVGFIAGAASDDVTVDNGASKGTNKWCDEDIFQIAFGATFTDTHLDCDLALKIDTETLINSGQTLRGDFSSKVYISTFHSIIIHYFAF